MTKLHTILLTGTLSLLGCGGGEPEQSVVPEPEVIETDSETSLKLYLFDCGRLGVDSPVGFSIQDDETDVRELVTPCYIVDHPDGRMLWDAGLPSSLAASEEEDGDQRLDRTLADQLAELDLGFDLSSLDYVAFSHMHFDHVGRPTTCLVRHGWSSRSNTRQCSLTPLASPRLNRTSMRTCVTPSTSYSTETTMFLVTGGFVSSRHQDIPLVIRCCSST